jgi:orotate phosphoribosyltransferase
LKQIIPLLSAGLASEDAHQAVGFGVGASFLVGGLVLHEEHNFRGGILRDLPKKYGTAKMLEGALCSDRRVAIVDDILNSGQTACHVASRLKTLGFEEIIFFSILRFAWGNGAARLEQDGVSAYSLAEVTMLDSSNLHDATPASRRSRIYHRIRKWLNSGQYLE